MSINKSIKSTTSIPKKQSENISKGNSIIIKDNNTIEQERIINNSQSKKSIDKDKANAFEDINLINNDRDNNLFEKNSMNKNENKQTNSLGNDTNKNYISQNNYNDEQYNIETVPTQINKEYKENYQIDQQQTTIENTNINILSYLENRISSLEMKISSCESKNSENSTKNELIKNNIQMKVDELVIMNKNLNDNMINRLKDLFINEIESSSNLISSLKLENEKQKYEIERQNLLIQEKEKEILIKDSNLSLQFEANKQMKMDFFQLSLLIEEGNKENLILKMENETKSKEITTLNEELNEIKSVIGKLSEVRVILNKYFSTQFEQFSQNEKNLISEVKEKLEGGNIKLPKEGKEQYIKYDNKDINRQVNNIETEISQVQDGRSKRKLLTGRISTNPDDDFWYENKKRK